MDRTWSVEFPPNVSSCNTNLHFIFIDTVVSISLYKMVPLFVSQHSTFYMIWLRVADEGSISVWMILLIKSYLKYCIHINNILCLYLLCFRTTALLPLHLNISHLFCLLSKMILK